MSSDEDISDIDSGEDVVFPPTREDADNMSSDDEGADMPDLEDADRIDDDDLIEDDVDELDVMDALEDEVIVSEVSDRNHKKIIIVHDDDRQTSNTIQRPEMTEAIGIRASQIERGSPVFTDVNGYTDPILMAKKEFVDRANPLIVERALSDNGTRAIVEHWKVRDMTFPITSREIMMISHSEPRASKPKSKGTGKKTGGFESNTLEHEFHYL